MTFNLPSQQTGFGCQCQFLDTLDKIAPLSWRSEEIRQCNVKMLMLIQKKTLILSLIPAWIASDMSIPALHDGGKGYPGAHWALQICLQILWQHKGRVFPILEREGKVISVRLGHFQALDLALSTRHMASCLSVYHQVCHLTRNWNFLKEAANTNLLPPLLSMMTLNGTTLTP